MPYNAFILDCDTKLRVGSPLANGCGLYRSLLPKNWTIDFDFALSPGHTTTAVFAVDAQAPVTLMQPPYAPPHHYLPLGVADGSHAIKVTSLGVAQPTFNFTLAESLPVSKAVWGSNFIVGANNPANDPIAHPELVTAQKALNQKWVRLWSEYPAMVSAGDAYWTVCRNWRKLGFKVALVEQYPGKQINLTQSADTVKRAIAGAAIDAYMHGNECNSSAYFNGTMQQLVAKVNQDAPLLHAAGILNIAPSVVNNVAYLNQAAMAGLFKQCDALDHHAYGTGLSLVPQAQAIAIANRVAYWISECGVTGPADTLAMLKQLSLLNTTTVFPYSQLPSGNPNFASFVLDANYQPNGPQPGGMYAAYAAGMK
jgi:hypothetical protein